MPAARANGVTESREVVWRVSWVNSHPDSQTYTDKFRLCVGEKPTKPTKPTTSGSASGVSGSANGLQSCETSVPNQRCGRYEAPPGRWRASVEHVQAVQALPGVAEVMLRDSQLWLRFDRCATEEQRYRVHEVVTRRRLVGRGKPGHTGNRGGTV